MLKAVLQVVVADPVGVTWGLRASANGKQPGLPIVVLGEHGDLPLDVAGGQLIADLVVDERLSAVLDLSRFRKGEQVRFMTDFSVQPGSPRCFSSAGPSGIPGDAAGVVLNATAVSSRDGWLTLYPAGQAVPTT